MSEDCMECGTPIAEAARLIPKSRDGNATVPLCGPCHGRTTREGLARARAAGVRLGRRPVLPMEVVRRIVWERHGGRKLREIAEDLTADGVPTARGGREWSTSSIQAVLAGQDAAKVNTRT